MTKRERYQRAKELFEQALERPADERASFLEKAAHGDDALLAEVQTLLRRDAAEEAIPEHLSETLTLEAMQTTVDPMPERVGNFRILSILGEGGMGTVYLAEQSEPVRRRVALKVIKLGMDTKEVVARFEAERQALALMNHPNVAKVHDAGATESGRPFFVMEHVPGVSITEHCDRERLTTRQRLELFQQVCNAVQHAHQKGIIHRDIKPSNVLVTMQDGRPVPKVIDFGVAKATNQRLTEKTIFTEQGRLIGTPEYMSPEQAEMTAIDIDTRTDIYSLGVLLYELLVGSRPFEPKSLREAGYAEAQRIIREVEPPKPSTRLSSLGDASTTISEKRRSNKRCLIRLIRGDLDWIVMKCLEKDRTRRYDTASALVLEIDRHLNNEPVRAGPPSAMYRARKFLRRNRTTTIAALTSSLVLIAATVTSVSFALKASQDRALAERREGEARKAKDSESEARRLAEEREKEAVRQTEIAQAINDFLNEDLLAAVAPSVEQGRGREVSMREVLDEAARRIEAASEEGGRFHEKPMVEVAIRTTLGLTYSDLGENAKAEKHMTRAYRLSNREVGPTDLATLEAATQLAIIYDRQGRYTDGERLLRETLDKTLQIVAPDNPGVVLLKHNIATSLMFQGRYDEADEMYSDVETYRRQRYGVDHPLTLSTIQNRAAVALQSGRYEDAERILGEVIPIEEEALGPDDLSTLEAKFMLAILWKRTGRLTEAEELLRANLETRRRVMGDEHPHTLSTILELADLYRVLHQFDQSETLSRESLDIHRRVLGPEHPHTLVQQNNLALVLEAQGDHDGAAELLRQTLDVQQKKLGKEHLDSIRSMFNLALTLWKAGDYTEADSVSSTVINLAESALGKDHPLTFTAKSAFGAYYRETGEIDKAAKLHSELVEAAIAIYGEGGYAHGHALREYGDTLFRQGELHAAEEPLLKGIALLEADQTPDPLRFESIELGCITLARLYGALHAAQPDRGYDAKAAEWRAKLADWQATTQPAEATPSSP